MDNRREGEENYGKKLPPSERLLNVAKAVAVVIPLFGAGWFSNTDTAKQLYATEETQKVLDIEPTDEAAVSQDAPAKIIERTIIREKECDIGEVMNSHVEALH